MRLRLVAAAAVIPSAVVVWFACSDGPVDPLRRVVQVIASRDFVALDVGDSALLRAEARDAIGDRIREATITWSAVPANIVTVSATGNARATGPGQGLIIAEAGVHADTVQALVLPPIIATTLSSELDTLTALGDSRIIAITSASAAGPRGGHYNVTSSDYGVAWASFDPDRSLVTVQAAGVGSAYVRVVERMGTRDSTLIVVRQEAARVSLPFDELEGYLARSSQVSATVLDRRGNPIPGAQIGWRTLDTTVAAVTAAGLLSYRGIGTTHLIAEMGAGVPDTAVVHVEDMPGIVLSVDSIVLGTGQGSETLWAGPSDYYVALLGNYVTLTIGDTSVATAPDSVLWVQLTGSFTVAARQPGRTMVIASAPGFHADTAWVSVSASRAMFSANDLGPITIHSLPVGTGVGFGAQIGDSVGVRRRLLQTVTVTFTSSDTTVLKWPYPELILYAGAESTPVEYADARAPGEVTVYASAPGFRTDSLRLRVTSLPKLELAGWHTIGLRQKTFDRPWRLTTNGVWTHPDAAVTFTRSNPTIATFPTDLALPSTHQYLDFAVEGLALGVDTIVATAPNFESDTAVLVVTTPRLLMADSVDAGAFAAAVGDSLGAKHLPLDTTTLLLTSSDTAVGRPPRAVRLPSDPWGTATVVLTVLDSGYVTLHVADSAGVLPPDSIVLHLRLRTDLSVVENAGYGPLAIGTRQRLEEVRLVALTPGPGVVYLASTDPAVLKVPDSLDITFPAGVHIPTAGGAVPGAARIIASRPGFIPASSQPIEVGIPRSDLRAPDTAYAGGTGYLLYVSPLDQRGIARQPDDTVVATVRALDPGVTIGEPTLAVPAGAWVSESVRVAFTTPGAVRLVAEDRRAVATPYRPDTATVHVVRPPLNLLTNGGTVGVGQVLSALLSRPSNVVADPVTVSVTHTGERTSSSTDPTLPAGGSALTYTLVGRSVGTDTLVLSADGYSSDTARIHVTEGRVTLFAPGLGPPTAVRVGDSVAVYLATADSSGRVRAVADVTVFSLSATPGITLSDGTRAISEIAVPASTALSRRFYLKGRSAGPATVTVWNLDYTTLTLGLTVGPAGISTAANATP
ncbi:MAG TPA: hypothetical protein VGQ25_01750 [Gemmatimonadales bacterium]|nr:hypothetical protein [Gemmatimonadales bacterium]